MLKAANASRYATIRYATRSLGLRTAPACSANQAMPRWKPNVINCIVGMFNWQISSTENITRVKVDVLERVLAEPELCGVSTELFEHPFTCRS